MARSSACSPPPQMTAAGQSRLTGPLWPAASPSPPRRCSPSTLNGANADERYACARPRRTAASARPDSKPHSFTGSGSAAFSTRAAGAGQSACCRPRPVTAPAVIGVSPCCTEPWCRPANNRATRSTVVAGLLAQLDTSTRPESLPPPAIGVAPTPSPPASGSGSRRWCIRPLPFPPVPEPALGDLLGVPGARARLFPAQTLEPSRGTGGAVPPTTSGA
jgi:hypothetical protein